ncbi:MAG: oligosaccharide flippase family protein [Proteobacteria bacterium]|nr:oligosaccharide flippase family protein [Pseudomonadota bacterium]
MELSRGQNVQKQDGYRRKVMTGTVTTIVAQLFRVGATIGTVIVASRILSPTDYGIYAMAAPVTGFAFLFQNIGFDHAVVQSDDVSDVQLSSLFWLNIGLCLVLALGLTLGLTGCAAIQGMLEEGGQRPTVRILAYNIRHGEGMDRELDLERVAAVIRGARPDIVALQEVDRNVSRTGRVDQAARLGDLTGMDHAFGAFMEYQGGEYGMAILSRWPIVASVNHELPGGTEPRSTLAARIRLPGGAGEVIVSGVHLYRTEGQRFSQAREIVDIFEQVSYC